MIVRDGRGQKAMGACAPVQGQRKTNAHEKQAFHVPMQLAKQRRVAERRFIAQEQQIAGKRYRSSVIVVFRRKWHQPYTNIIIPGLYPITSLVCTASWDWLSRRTEQAPTKFGYCCFQKRQGLIRTRPSMSLCHLRSEVWKHPSLSAFPAPAHKRNTTPTDERRLRLTLPKLY